MISNLVLEDLRIPQVTLPHEWVETVPMALTPEIQDSISTLEAALWADHRGEPFPAVRPAQGPPRQSGIV